VVGHRNVFFLATLHCTRRTWSNTMDGKSRQRSWHEIVARWFTGGESRFLNLIGIDPVALSYSRALVEWRDGGPRPDAFFAGEADGRSPTKTKHRASQSTSEDRSDPLDAWTGAVPAPQRHA
jgi:hypothetical protein